MGDVQVVEGPAGPRVLIDSVALAQAVYVYRPIVDATGSIVDLEIVSMNEAARHVPLSDEVVVGRRVSAVFVDMEAALDAANIVWSGGRAPTYGIERRGLIDDQPVVVHYEVSTFRSGEFVVQVSVDHTVVNQLVSADDRFRTMADESTEGLILLADSPEDGSYVPTYANQVALRAVPQLRVGRPLPAPLQGAIAPLLAEVVAHRRARTVVRHRVLARLADYELSLLRLSDGQVLVIARELVDEKNALLELQRSDRLLDAIGQGSFGAIHVLEAVVADGRVTEVTRLWGSQGTEAAGGTTLALDDVFTVGSLLEMVGSLYESDDVRRHGWVTVPRSEPPRSAEYTLVKAGDHFVLEFVERTAELEARTALAEVSAAIDVQRAFLSRVSHELRSPLNVIHGYGQLLRRMSLPVAAGEHLARIEDGVERLVRIVDDLIVLGQLDQGLMRFELTSTSLAGVLRLVGERLDHDADVAPSTVTLETNDSDTGDTVETDAVRFAEVVRLLIEGSSLAVPGVVFTVAPFVRGTSRGIAVSAAVPSPALDRLWSEVVDGGVIPGAGLRLAVARELSRSLSIRWERRDPQAGGAMRLVLLAPVTPVAP